MAAHRGFGDKRAGVIVGLFHAVGRILAVVGNVEPDVSALACGVEA